MKSRVNLNVLIMIVFGVIASLGCASGFDYSEKDGEFDRMAIVDNLLANYPLSSKSDNADVSPNKNRPIATAKFEDDPTYGGVFIPGYYAWRYDSDPKTLDLVLNSVKAFDPTNFVISADFLIDHIATGDEVQKNINPNVMSLLVWDDNQRELGIMYWFGKIALFSKNSKYLETNIAFPLQKWNTLAIAYRAEKNNLIELYLNGKLIGTQHQELKKLPFFFSTTNFANGTTYRGNIRNIIIGTPKSQDQ